MSSMINPVLFVRAKTEYGRDTESRTQKKSWQGNCGEKAGKEIREFYESVIASSSSQPTGTKHEKQNNIHATATKIIKLDSSGCSGSTNLLSSKPKESLHTVPAHRKARTPVSKSAARTNELLRFCQEGNTREVKRILKRGEASLGVTDQYGWNALMCAAFSGHVGLVKYILRREPSVFHHETKKGESVIDLVRMADNEPMVNLLRQFESDASILNGQETSSSSSNSGQPSWCEVCKAEFSDDKKVHQQSTAHLFSCGLTPAPTLYHIPESNRGFQMMLQDGWDKEKGLGKLGEGHKFPVKTTLKRDRQGLGTQESDSKPRITHFKPFDTDAVKRPRIKHDKKKQNVPVDKKKSKSKSSGRHRHEEMEKDFRMSFHTYP